MKRFQAPAHPLLQPFVDRYWGWESDAGEHVALPTLLTGTGADLFLHYRAPFRHDVASRTELMPQSHLVCVRRRAIHLLPGYQIGFVAVRFRVGGVCAFTRLSGGELIDRTPSAAELWPTTHRALESALHRATTLARRVAAIERHLLAHLAPCPDLLSLVAAQRIYRHAGRLELRAAAAASDLGPRQFERRIKAWTGQSPAEIRSCSRLQKTIRMLALHPELRPLDAALMQGYFDQSHFCKAFERIGVGSPDRFRASGGLMTHFYNTPLPARR